MGIIQTLGMWKERIMRMFKGNIKNEFGVTGITSNAMEDAITNWHWESHSMAAGKTI